MKRCYAITKKNIRCKNMARNGSSYCKIHAGQKKKPWPVRVKKWISENTIVVTVGLLALGIGTISGVVSNIERILETYNSVVYYYQYTGKLQRPYPNRLSRSELESWSSGKLRLALFQIDGYLGRLDTQSRWLEQCLTDPFAFPNMEAGKSQFNKLYKLRPSVTDDHNYHIISERISELENSRSEISGILRLSDPFERLLTRSSIQLLDLYRHKEIGLLNKSDLWILRNSIYAKKGFIFKTKKLEKYFNRREFYSPNANFSLYDLSAVEICNAYILEEVHEQRELGARGRAVLITTDGSQYLNVLRHKICGCLEKPSTGVECSQDPTFAPSEAFKSSVDFVLRLRNGDKSNSTWHLVDRSLINDQDQKKYSEGQSKIISGLLSISSSFSEAIGSGYQQSDFTSIDRDYLGLTFSLSRQVSDQLKGSPLELEAIGQSICTGIAELLEEAGPYIPSIAQERQFQISVDGTEPAKTIKIIDRPIQFGERRQFLTSEYLRKQLGKSTDITFEPRMIVIHDTSDASLEEYFEKLKPSSVPDGHLGLANNEALNFSVHYIVDRDGTIYKLMEDYVVARHVSGLDTSAIGVKNVGGENLNLTSAQLEANEFLVDHLKKKYPKIQYIIGYHEHRFFRDHEFWVGKVPEHDDSSTGPGEIYINSLRSSILGLGLKGTEEFTQ
ncbi:YARHG domain-containing protein [Ruegeria atlantica]|uniref:YARHG domain-containing protein n=1 Tax=Ruegeria atlantica TaxID=81569 RepID=UPI00147FEBA1|nr:YARHG domain-containing protein [Ruegeria atlantica]